MLNITRSIYTNYIYALDPRPIGSNVNLQLQCVVAIVIMVSLCNDSMR